MFDPAPIVAGLIPTELRALLLEVLGEMDSGAVVETLTEYFGDRHLEWGWLVESMKESQS